MPSQLSLRFDRAAYERDHETLAEITGGGFVRCYECGLICPPDQISGGLCGNCADPIPEEEEKEN